MMTDGPNPTPIPCFPSIPALSQAEGWSDSLGGLCPGKGRGVAQAASYIGFPPGKSARPANGLDVQVLHIQGVVFDELSPRLDVLSHQSGKDRFALGDILELHGEERSPFGIHCRLPELRSRHLSQALIALDG